MQLISAREASENDLRYLVREVKLVKLFYVTTGRNAWWTTWITRYSRGCMHTTMRSAKAYCEERRVQGTVFYVHELPSLALCSLDRALIVSEINTDDFLARFNLKRLNEILEVLPTSTMTLQQCISVFNVHSALWPASYPKRNSAILSFCSNADTLEVIDANSDLKSWASSSAGPTRNLRWASRPFTQKREFLHYIFLALYGRL